MATKELEKEFTLAMFDIYRRAKIDAGYNATRYLQLLQKYGGLETAKMLLYSPVSEGYIALWERGRLDLTVEALILKEKWESLFSDEERKIAWERLRDYGYQGDN